jgi:hypothetical protein
MDSLPLLKPFDLLVWTVCICWSHLIYLYGQSASVEPIWFTCMDSLPLLKPFDLLVWTVCPCWSHLIYLYGQSASVEAIWFTCMDSLHLLKPFDLLVWTVCLCWNHLIYLYGQSASVEWLQQGQTVHASKSNGFNRGRLSIQINQMASTEADWPYK